MHPSEIIIRAVNPSEVEMLRYLSKATFTATYAAHNTPENMRNYIRQHFNHETLASELEDSNINYFFAQLGNEIVGYLKLNIGPAQTESRFTNTLEIERIYVTASQHGKGYGVKLLSKAIEVGKRKNLQFVWLGVWDQNEKAINFYERNGFYKDGLHPFMLGDEPQRDYIMKLNLASH